MSLPMPSPTRNKKTGVYQYRARVPADLAEKAKGETLIVLVAGKPRELRIGDMVKVSLSTHDPAAAKERFREVDERVQAFWQTVRTGPRPLTPKQVYALAGEIRAAWVDVFDDDPGTPAIWDNAKTANAGALAGGSVLTIRPTKVQRQAALESRFGGLIDSYLKHKGILADKATRPALLQAVAEAMVDAVRVNHAKAGGDYSDSGETLRYPKWSDTPPEKKETQSGETLTAIVDNEEKRRALGRDATPLPKATAQKYRRHCAEYAAFAETPRAGAVSAQGVMRWMEALQAEAKLSNKTIGDKLASLRTVVEWGRRQSPGEFFAHGHPLSGVMPPQAAVAPQGSRTFTLAEARTILAAARSEQDTSRRWLPWLCAYSGARIEEIAGLTPDNFFQSGEFWFAHVRPQATRRLKNRNSERRVPLHPAVIAEGFPEFLKGKKQGERLFTSAPSNMISRWVRGKLKITREVPPNHGWRHLFEDLCTDAGVSDDARAYVTGRGTGTSRDRYGRSDVALAGLAREISKIASLLPEPPEDK